VGEKGTDMTALNPENVTNTMKYCLFKEDEIHDGKAPSDAVIVDGIMRRYGLHPVRLGEKRDDIKSMLSYLPGQFKASSGGGWSFLNACEDRNGEMWTGSQTTVADLFALGMAIGAVEYLMPREMWCILPGGVPYLVVKDESA
jgi:hypothetical protein